MNRKQPVSVSGGLTKQKLVLFGTTGIVTHWKEEYTLTVYEAEVIQVLNLQTFSTSIVCKAKVEQQQQTWVHVHMWY